VERHVYQWMVVSVSMLYQNQICVLVHYENDNHHLIKRYVPQSIVLEVSTVRITQIYIQLPHVKCIYSYAKMLYRVKETDETVSFQHVFFQINTTQLLILFQCQSKFPARVHSFLSHFSCGRRNLVVIIITWFRNCKCTSCYCPSICLLPFT
jgi:hypothetical protein